MSGTSSILLTHWDPAFYEPNADPMCIAELALNCLLYDRVLVRAIDLVMNTFVARRLHANKAHFELLRELIDHGCVTLLTTSPEDYRDEQLRETARRSPIRARALDQLRYRSNAGEPWQPEEWQWDFCDALDSAVGNSSNHSAIQLAQPFPQENDFAVKLAEILRDREKYDLAGMDQFADIDDHIADEFIRFCTEPDSFKRFLAGDPKASPRDAFFRHEAYQCARHFPNPDGITNLAQSVYMGLECQREDTEGRFGRKLWEPPLRFPSQVQKVDALEEARHIQLATRRRSIPLALRPGLGKALALTRKSTEFRRLQEGFGAWDALSALDGMDEHLSSVAEKFGEAAGKSMIPYGRAERCARISVKTLYVGARFLGHSFLLSSTDGVNLDPVVDEFASNHLAKLAEKMVHIVRSGSFSRGVGEQVRRALTVRSASIRFSPSEAEQKDKRQSRSREPE